MPASAGATSDTRATTADCGLPGQPGDQRRPAVRAGYRGQQHREAGSHLDGVHHVLGAQLGQRRVQVVDRAVHRAAGGADQLRAPVAARCATPSTCASSVSPYRPRSRRPRSGAEPAQPGRHRRAERVADPPVAGQPRGQQLVAEDQHRGARARGARSAGRTRRTRPARERPASTGGTRGQQLLAAPGLLAGLPPLRQRHAGCRRPDRHRSGWSPRCAGCMRRAVRYHGAGGDLHAGAVLGQRGGRRRRRAPGRRSRHGSGAAHRPTVHTGRRERGQVGTGGDAARRASRPRRPPAVPRRGRPRARRRRRTPRPGPSPGQGGGPADARHRKNGRSLSQPSRRRLRSRLRQRSVDGRRRASWSTAWASIGPSTASPSRAPPVEPGRLTTRVRPGHAGQATGQDARWVPGRGCARAAPRRSPAPRSRAPAGSPPGCGRSASCRSRRWSARRRYPSATAARSARSDRLPVRYHDRIVAPRSRVPAARATSSGPLVSG